MRYTDRSRIETTMHCGYERYLRYHHDGMGIVPEGNSNDAEFGLAIHRALAVGMAGGDLEAMLACLEPMPIEGETPDGHHKYEEYYNLGYGMCYTFTTRFKKRLLSVYDLVPELTETELTMPLSEDLTWMARLDGALRRKSDSMLYVLEWKTSSYLDSLTTQYEYSLQTAMEVATLQHHLNEYVGGMLMIGLNKGKKYRVTSKEYDAGLRGDRRVSPFTYYYCRDLTGFKLELSQAYKPGWERRLVDDPAAWVKWLENNSPDVFEEVFSVPFPLHISPNKIERVKAEIIAIESRVMGLTPLHSWTNCNNHDGIMNKACPYIPVCHANEWDGFVPRTPNHPIEASHE